MKRFLLLFLLVLFSISITIVVPGCASTRSRGNLSETMEKASDEHEGSRKVEDKEKKDEEEESSSLFAELVWHLIFHSDDEQNDEMEVEVTTDSQNESIAVEENSPFIVEENKTLFPYAVTLSYSQGFIGDRRFENPHRFSLGLVGQTEASHQMVVYGMFQLMPLRSTSSLYRSIKSTPFSLGIGIDFRKLSDSNSLLHPYYILGLQLDALFWSYRNSIYADSYDEYGYYDGVEQINSDGLFGLDLHTGLGFNLIGADNAAIGLEIRPGIKLWWGESFEGFNNDIFDPFYYLDFNVKFDLIRH